MQLRCIFLGCGGENVGSCVNLSHASTVEEDSDSAELSILVADGVVSLDVVDMVDRLEVEDCVDVLVVEEESGCVLDEAIEEGAI